MKQMDEIESSIEITYDVKKKAIRITKKGLNSYDLRNSQTVDFLKLKNFYESLKGALVNTIYVSFYDYDVFLLPLNVVQTKIKSFHFRNCRGSFISHFIKEFGRDNVFLFDVNDCHPLDLETALLWLLPNNVNLSTLILARNHFTTPSTKRILRLIHDFCANLKWLGLEDLLISHDMDSVCNFIRTNRNLRYLNVINCMFNTTKKHETMFCEAVKLSTITCIGFGDINNKAFFSSLSQALYQKKYLKCLILYGDIQREIVPLLGQLKYIIIDKCDSGFFNNKSDAEKFYDGLANSTTINGLEMFHIPKEEDEKFNNSVMKNGSLRIFKTDREELKKTLDFAIKRNQNNSVKVISVCNILLAIQKFKKHTLLDVVAKDMTKLLCSHLIRTAADLETWK